MTVPADQALPQTRRERRGCDRRLPAGHGIAPGDGGLAGSIEHETL